MPTEATELGVHSFVRNWRWPFALGLAWFLAALLPLTDGDIWWQLAAGREMIASGSVLRVDPFTYTALGTPWLNVHWLYQLLVFGVHSLSANHGELLLVLFHAALWGCAGGVWVAVGGGSGVRLGRSSGMTAAVLLVVSVPMLWSMHFLLLARPLPLTLLLLGLQALAFDSTLAPVRKWSLICLLQVALANVQGLFLLGPVMLVLRGLSRPGFALNYWRAWRGALVPCLVTAVSVVNPWGLQMLGLPFRLLQRIEPGTIFSNWIAENVPPHHALLAWMHGEAWTADTMQACGLLALTLAWLVLLALRRGRQAFALLPWIALAWLAQRNIPIAAMLALPSLAMLSFGALRGFAAENAKDTLQRGLSWLGVGLLIALALAQLSWWRVYPSAVSPYRFPIGAAETLSRIGSQASVPLRVFCESRHCGYLSWNTHPQVLTHWDGRFILRDSAFVDEVLAFEQAPESFAAFAVRNHIDVVVLPLRYPSYLVNLEKLMFRDQNWILVQQDETAMTFIRKDLQALAPTVDP